jgi:LacI family transcriptional regulator
VHHGDARDLDFVRHVMKTDSPEAFVCSNDFEAAKLMHTLERLEVRIPQDVAIVGFNDDPYARLLTISLTTMRQPCTQLGAAAVKLLVNRMSNRTAPVREIRLSCELVERESCGAALGKKSPPNA